MANVADIPVDSVSTINEGFKQGGDLTIRSADDVNFSVHSLFLSVASPVFSDLLKTKNQNESIRFSEKSEVLALILQFIYPLPSPIIPSLELFNATMRVADKYQLTNIKARLREQFTMADSPVSVYSNPLAALSVASVHGFIAEAELAAKFASKQYDLGKMDDLKRLIDTAPATAALAKLIGIPAVKARVLTEVLFQFGRSPMHMNGGNLDSLVCGYCREPYRDFIRQSPPEWQSRWAHWIFEEIKERPIAEWKGYFNHSNFNRSFYQPHLSATFHAYKHDKSSPTCGCVGKVAGHAAQFQPWADAVYEQLKSRLTVIAELEAQMYNTSPEAKLE
ncbi:hypothetical protein FRC11_014083 [Ceratobasidium sp. 423]|nr:hypothetical protein FRC11_014083 [Ceratobasidium sp. 423]